VLDWNAWQLLAILQHELLLFAGIFFLVGALDDFGVDCVWLWLKVTGRANVARIVRGEYAQRPLAAPIAVLIPAWHEAGVIGNTVAHMLRAWSQAGLTVYVGVYRNDPATLEAAMRGASWDARVRLVIHDCDGPTTKADCLNRIYEAMRDDERRAGQRYAGCVFHDAEDMVDPAALAVLSEAIARGVDFAQLPVEPIPQTARSWLGSHYCEEFAEAHGKGMVVRDALGAGLPAAGVGCAISRAALHRLCRRRLDMKPFEPQSLTEDYELGLAIAEDGGVCRFLRVRGDDGAMVATRAYFPSELGAIVRQKTRWVHGIALQGWDRTGWTGGLIERWMRARDRRGPLSAMVLCLGYILLALTAAIGLAITLGAQAYVPLSPLVEALLWTNLAFFAWRAALRFAFTARVYGLAEAGFAVLRIPMTNIIAIMSGWRAVRAYMRTLTGGPVQWDKTVHVSHPARFDPVPPVRTNTLRPALHS
jgi:adsorption protein B